MSEEILRASGQRILDVRIAENPGEVAKTPHSTVSLSKARQSLEGPRTARGAARCPQLPEARRVVEITLGNSATAWLS